MANTTNRKKTPATRRPSKAERRAAERRSRQRRRLAVGLGVLAAVGVILAFVLTGSNDTGKSSAAGSVSITGSSGQRLAAGQAVPDFSAPALVGGGRVSWSDYSSGPVVLAIWAPWCPHCQKELPILSRVVGDTAGVRLVSVTTAIGQEPGPTPLGYMQDHGLTFPVAVDDANATLGRGLGVSEFPTVYYVRDGSVVQVTTGEVSEADLRTLLSQLTA